MQWGAAARPAGPLFRSRQAPRTRSAHPSGLWPPDLPPPVPWPPAGPRRRLPYLRSPGPPFYFLKPSHKAPRRPGLVCFLPETPARAHFPNRLRARRAASACARSPALRRAPESSPVLAQLVARACALTAPASCSRRPRGRGQGRAGQGRVGCSPSDPRARGEQRGIRSSLQPPGRSGFSCLCFPFVFRPCPRGWSVDSGGRRNKGLLGKSLGWGGGRHFTCASPGLGGDPGEGSWGALCHLRPQISLLRNQYVWQTF